MSYKVIVILLCLKVITVYSWGAIQSVDEHLETSDLDRFNNIFKIGMKSGDLQAVYYSLQNSPQLPDSEKLQICERTSKLFEESALNIPEKHFYLSGIYKLLRCKQQVFSSLKNFVINSLSNDESSIQNIYYNLVIAKNINHEINKQTISNVAKNLKMLLDKDISLISLAYAFNAAIEIGSTASFVLPYIADVMVQSDEIDGKMLQFEGGLSITALIITASLRLSETLQSPIPLTADQAMKFANYFMSRSSIQTPKGAYILLESIKTLSKFVNIAPICIKLIGSEQYSAEKPNIHIKIVDLFGKQLNTQFKNIYASFINKNTNETIADKLPLLLKSSDKTVYELKINPDTLKSGAYILEITADKYIQTTNIKILRKIKINNFEIGVEDSDSTSSNRKQIVQYPNILSTILNAEQNQKIFIKFNLVDEKLGKSIKIQQVFVKFTNKETSEEIIFIAENEKNELYKLDLDINVRSAEFNYNSGVYDIDLLIGDSFISQSFNWKIGSIKITFPHGSKDLHTYQYKANLPEIIHQFRQPDNRPPNLVADIFTVICLLPLLLFIILFIQLRVNLHKLSFNLSTIGFHLGFGMIFVLYNTFWLNLNMFEVIKYLIPLAILTFFCCNRLLRRIIVA